MALEKLNIVVEAGAKALASTFNKVTAKVDAIIDSLGDLNEIVDKNIIGGDNELYDSNAITQSKIIKYGSSLIIQDSAYYSITDYMALDAIGSFDFSGLSVCAAWGDTPSLALFTSKSEDAFIKSYDLSQTFGTSATSGSLNDIIKDNPTAKYVRFTLKGTTDTDVITFSFKETTTGLEGKITEKIPSGIAENEDKSIALTNSSGANLFTLPLVAADNSGIVSGKMYSQFVSNTEACKKVLGESHCLNLIYSKGDFGNVTADDFETNGCTITYNTDSITIYNGTSASANCILNLYFDIIYGHKYAVVSNLAGGVTMGIGVLLYTSDKQARNPMYGTYRNTAGIYADINEVTVSSAALGRISIGLSSGKTVEIKSISIFDLGDSSSDYYGTSTDEAVTEFSSQSTYPQYLFKIKSMEDKLDDIDVRFTEDEASIKELGDRIDALKVDNKFPDTTFAFLGDSITYQGFNGYSAFGKSFYSDGWVKKWADLNNIDVSQVINRGIGGTWLSLDTTSPMKGYSMVERWNMDGENPSDSQFDLRIPQADVLVIMGGTNDNNPSGDLTTLDDTSTITGALNTIIKGYLALYPESSVMVCTLIRHNSGYDSSGTAETLKKATYAARIKEYCQSVGIVCCDFYNETEINDFSTKKVVDFPVLTTTYIADTTILLNDWADYKAGDTIASSGQSTSEFIEVSENQRLSIGAGRFALYNSNKEYLGVTNRDEYIVGTDVKYVRHFGSTSITTQKLYNLTGITLKDMVHPSSLGHERMARVFDTYIRKVVYQHK